MNEILEEGRLKITKDAIGMFPKEAQEAVFTPPEKRTAMQWQMYYRSASRLPKDAAVEKSLKGDVKERYAALKKELAQFDSIKPPDPPVAEAMVDQGREAPATHILAKGVWDAPLDEVQPGFLSILDPNPAKIVPPEGIRIQRPPHGARQLADRPQESADRARDGESHLALSLRPGHRRQLRAISASWASGPSNPQLLDYLASAFVENGWSIKKMHRMIMLSNAYQQSSAYQEAAAKVDPDNKLLWRFARRRLEGEVIRDSMLFASGQLNLKMGGPGVFPPLPPGVSMPDRII